MGCQRIAIGVVVLLLGLPSCKRLFGAAGGGTEKPVAADQGWKRPSSDLVAATIYDGKLEQGWQDWGWGAHDLGHGPAGIDFSNYGGWILWNPGLPSGIEGLAFRMRAPSSYGNFLELRLAYQKNEASFPAVRLGRSHLRALPDGWFDVYVPWNELDPAKLPADQLTLHAYAAVGAERVRLDKLVLTAPDPKATPARPPEKLHSRSRVDCSAPDHAISPYIYGIAGTADPKGVGATGRRWGGNRTTRYNWQARFSNAGKDWFFENTDGGDFRQALKENHDNAVFTALTVPIIGWVAKDAKSSGFPVSKFGPQHATDPYRSDAGDGDDQRGKHLEPGPPEQTSVPADPEFIRQWIEAIRADDGQRGARGVHMYILDNEPSLWSVTHRDVHPRSLTYDELLDRTLRYAHAIRAADPEAVIAGPAEWGWSAYFFSPKDLESGTFLRPDRRAHGDLPLLAWYLKALREHEQKTGEKLLDVLDVHFYPQAAGVYGNAADTATAALRIRSTRALWDPTYKDESWINEPVRLIPRLKEWVSEYYPGLRVSLGEYNFGGEADASGAIALAEALGRFGTEGLDYAFYWVDPPKNSAAYWAFRAFRNFDGSGGHFLERSLKTTTSAPLSLFASRDTSGKHLVLIALNLDATATAASALELAGCGSPGTIRRFSYTPRSGALVAAATSQGQSLNVELPPHSFAVLDITLD